MPYKLYFYLSEDELSGRILTTLEQLIGDLRDRVKVSSRGFWPADVVTNVRIALPSAFGRKEFLELEIWTTTKDYENGLKQRFRLSGLPAARIGEKTVSGSRILEIASNMRTLLSGDTPTTAEQVFYQLATTVQGRAEEEEKTEAAGVFTSNILRVAMSEKMAKLEKMLRDKIIDEETYRKMRRIYEELLGEREK